MSTAIPQEVRKQDEVGHGELYSVYASWGGAGLADRGYPGDFTLESWRFLAAYAPDFLPEAMAMNYAAGRRYRDRLQRAMAGEA